MTPEAIAGHWASLRLFRDVPRRVFELVARQPGAARRLPVHTLVFGLGDPCDAVYVAIPDATEGGPTARGVVELGLADRPVDDVSSFTFEAGELFGDFEFVHAGLSVAGRRRSRARSLLPCTLLRFPIGPFAELVETNAAVRATLVKAAFRRLLDRLVEEKSYLAGDRDLALANWLVDTAETLGVREGQRLTFSRIIPQSEIAEFLGLRRETVSLKLKEWERAGILRTGGQSQRLEILDYPRIALLARIRRDRPRDVIAASVVEIDSLLEEGELFRARNLGLDLLAWYPGSPDLRHRVALAAIRSGNPAEAMGLLAAGRLLAGDAGLAGLSEAVYAGRAAPGVDPAARQRGDPDGSRPGLHDDDDDGGSSRADASRAIRTLVEDIAAIEARALKERAFLTEVGEERATLARLAGERYAAIHDAFGSAYTGINAAALFLISGDAKRAGAVARRVLARIGPAPTGYWQQATVGEARLILGETAEAAEAFHAAGFEADASDGRIASTRMQLRRLGTVAPERSGRGLAALPARRVAVCSGRIFHGDRYDNATQRQLEAEILASMASTLARTDVRHIYGGLACGADILVAMAALEAGVRFHAVLPFDAQGYLATSVAIGNPADAPERWNARYWRCLTKATSVRVAWPGASPARAALGAWFLHGARHAAGCALLRADELGSECILLALTSRDAPGTGVTGRLMTDWGALGRPVELLPLALDPVVPDTGAAFDPFRAVLFLWPTLDAAPPDLEQIEDIVKGVCQGSFEMVPRQSRDRRSGCGIVFDAPADAITVARHLALAGTPLEEPRIVLDFGPVAGVAGKVAPAILTRLGAAADLVGFPAGIPLATEAFAAHARAEGDSERFVAVGRQEPPSADSGQPGVPLSSNPAYIMKRQEPPPGPSPVTTATASARSSAFDPI